jgi:hypothetical protein
MSTSARRGLVTILNGITDEYEQVRDTKTQDEDCRSIQTIMTHVIGPDMDTLGTCAAWAGRWSSSGARRSRAQVAGGVRKMLTTIETRLQVGHERKRVERRWRSAGDRSTTSSSLRRSSTAAWRQIDRFLGR